jgi:anaerobic selenocysteine-containing dehydrogenase
MTLTIDDRERIISIRGKKDSPLSRGYACIKGLQAPEAHHGPQRLLHPLKRMADGSFARIPLDEALDEIAAKLAGIVERDGPEALAAFRGTVNVFSGVSGQIVPDFLAAFGSRGFYTTMTIDQSAKWVTIERLGMWSAGRQPLSDSDVLLLVGTNPMVSISVAGLMDNPTLSLKEAKARGLKLIVIDPRRTETGQHADLFLQPRPGEDAAILAGLLNLILTNGWHDAAFCAEHVEGLDALRAAVASFTPEHVEARAGIRASQLVHAAELFARDSRRGFAHAGTGVTMSPHSNLADHLCECLNVVCGRYLRAGEIVPNPGVLNPARPHRAEVIAPRRSWEKTERGRIGRHGMLFGEKMTAVLADEILTPGPGRIRALFVDGGNPASAVPDQRKIVAAMRDLELLVTIDPSMSTTARLSHYILPPTLCYEHADVAPPAYETLIFSRPFAAYTDAVIAPPADAEVMDDWRIFWEIARRAGRALAFCGEPLDMTTPPTSDRMHAIMCRGAPLSFEQLREAAGGIVDVAPVVVEPVSGNAARFAVAPHDVVDELAAALAKWPPAPAAQIFTHRLSSRRLREVSNSMYHDFPAIRRRMRYNPAYLHPDDLAASGLAPGDRVRIVSDHDAIEAIVEPDEDVRPGVVSMAHSWGGLPDEGRVEEVGSYTGLLISTDRDLETINAMPRQSAIPVRIERVCNVGSEEAEPARDTPRHVEIST